MLWTRSSSFFRRGQSLCRLALLTVLLVRGAALGSQSADEAEGIFWRSAVKAGQWLVHVQNGGGIWHCWYEPDERGASDDQGGWLAENGTPGAIRALIALHERTSRRDFLTGARKACEWLERQAQIPWYHHYTWRGDSTARLYLPCSYLSEETTTACIDALLDMHEATGEKRWLRAAQKGAGALLKSQSAHGGWGATSISGQPGQIYWYSTPRIVDTLLRLSGESGAGYLAAAQRGAGFLLRAQRKSGPWPRFYVEGISSARLYMEAHEGVLTGNGTPGAILSLLQCHARQRDGKYLAAARRAGDWLLSVRRGGWSARYPDFIYGYLTVEADVTPGAISSLVALYQATGETRYLGGAIDGARWLVSVRRGGWCSDYERTTDLPWHDYDQVTFRATPGAIEALLDVYSVSGERSFLDAALAAGRWLVAAQSEQGGWTSGYAGTKPIGRLLYIGKWGTPTVILTLLRLDRAARGELPVKRPSGPIVHAEPGNQDFCNPVKVAFDRSRMILPSRIASAEELDLSGLWQVESWDGTRAQVHVPGPITPDRTQWHYNWNGWWLRQFGGLDDPALYGKGYLADVVDLADRLGRYGPPAQAQAAAERFLGDTYHSSGAGSLVPSRTYTLSRSFSLPERWHGKAGRVLVIDRCYDEAQVWLNGVYLGFQANTLMNCDWGRFGPRQPGFHKGWIVPETWPYVYDVDGLLRPAGNNELRVQVTYHPAVARDPWVAKHCAPGIMGGVRMLFTSPVTVGDMQISHTPTAAGHTTYRFTVPLLNRTGTTWEGYACFSLSRRGQLLASADDEPGYRRRITLAPGTTPVTFRWRAQPSVQQNCARLTLVDLFNRQIEQVEKDFYGVVLETGADFVLNGEKIVLKTCASEMCEPFVGGYRQYLPRTRGLADMTWSEYVHYWKALTLRACLEWKNAGQNLMSLGHGTSRYRLSESGWLKDYVAIKQCAQWCSRGTGMAWNREGFLHQYLLELLRLSATSPTMIGYSPYEEIHGQKLGLMENALRTYNKELRRLDRQVDPYGRSLAYESDGVMPGGHHVDSTFMESEINPILSFQVVGDGKTKTINGIYRLSDGQELTKQLPPKPAQVRIKNSLSFSPEVPTDRDIRTFYRFFEETPRTVMLNLCAPGLVFPGAKGTADFAAVNQAWVRLFSPDWVDGYFFNYHLWNWTDGASNGKSGPPRATQRGRLYPFFQDFFRDVDVALDSRPSGGWRATVRNRRPWRLHGVVLTLQTTEQRASVLLGDLSPETATEATIIARGADPDYRVDYSSHGGLMQWHCHRHQPVRRLPAPMGSAEISRPGPKPRIVWTPPAVSVRAGTSAAVPLQIRNEDELGKVLVWLAGPPWVSSQPGELFLAAGTTARVQILLRPGTHVPPGDYRFTLTVSGPDVELYSVADVLSALPQSWFDRSQVVGRQHSVELVAHVVGAE